MTPPSLSHGLQLSAALSEAVVSNVQRMVALEGVRDLTGDVLSCSLFPHEQAKQQLLERCEEQLEYVAKIRASHEHWLDSILPGLAHDPTKTVLDIDPEFDAKFTREQVKRRFYLSHAHDRERERVREW